jgi:hypothetical protein
MQAIQLLISTNWEGEGPSLLGSRIAHTFPSAKVQTKNMQMRRPGQQEINDLRLLLLVNHCRRGKGKGD